MNRQLVILAVTGAVVLAGCARMMGQHPKSEPTRSSTQMQVQMTDAPAEEAAKAEAPKPKPKAAPKTAHPRR
ncbi:MAG TPA: hypothetical protein V6D05_08035 [Stenomitos sp.]